MSGLWLPMSPPDAEKEVIQVANHIYLFDSIGRKYIDGNSGLWNVPLGYSNQKIKQAVTSQLLNLPFANPEMFSNPAAELLAETLLAMLPKQFDHVFFTCTGSESTELAIKTVRKYQQLMRNYNRREIAVFSQSYHGNYYGSMSASGYGSEYHRGYKPLLSGFLELPLPYARKKKESSGDELQILCTQVKEILEKNRDRLAAIMIEPILGSAGVIELPSDLLVWVSEFARKNQILVIFDEISTGLGRTGRMFAFEHLGMIPDVLLLGKGLNNGYLPIGAVVIANSISRAFRMRSELLFHLSTQNSNPVCCAAAIETLRQITEDHGKIVREVNEKGVYFAKNLCEALHDKKQVSSVRGKGLMLAIEMTQEDETIPLNGSVLDLIIQSIKNNGVICSGTYIENTISCICFFLPYIITKDQMDEVIRVVQKVISSILI